MALAREEIPQASRSEVFFECDSVPAERGAEHGVVLRFELVVELDLAVLELVELELELGLELEQLALELELELELALELELELELELDAETRKDGNLDKSSRPASQLGLSRESQMA